LRPRRVRRGAGNSSAGFLLFLALAAPWFVSSRTSTTGLLAYFLGSEVVARVASDQFARHGEWYGLGRGLRADAAARHAAVDGARAGVAARAARGLRRWRAPEAGAEAPALLLALWVLLPLLVFCIARSRLPLYLLPIVRAAGAGGARRCRRARRPAALALAGRLGLLLLGAARGRALLPRARTPRPGRRRSAHARRAAARGRVRRGHAALRPAPVPGTEVETLSLDDLAKPEFNPEYDESLAADSRRAAHEHGVLYVDAQEDCGRRWNSACSRTASARGAGRTFHDRDLLRRRPLRRRR
jgi:hypothetical protein